MRTDPGSGWTVIESPDGAYSFAMPGVPAATAPSPDLAHHRYMLRLEGNSRGFDVDVRPAPIGVSVDAILDATERALLEAWSADLEKSETSLGPYGERREILAILSETTHHAVARIQVADGRVFVMSAVHIPEGLATLNREAAQFFESLEVHAQR